MRLLVLTLVLLTSVSFNSAHAQENISAYKIVEPGQSLNKALSSVPLFGSIVKDGSVSGKILFVRKNDKIEVELDGVTKEINSRSSSFKFNWKNISVSVDLDKLKASTKQLSSDSAKNNYELLKLFDSELLNDEIAALRGRASELEKQTKEFQAASAKSTDEKQAIEKTLARLQTDFEDLQTKYSEAQNQLTQKTAQLAESEGKLANAPENNSKRVSELETLSSSLTQTINYQKDEIENLKSKLTSFESTKAENDNSLAESKARISELEKEISFNAARVQELEAELSAKGTSSSEVNRDDLNNPNANLGSATHEANEMRAKIDGLESQIKELTTANNTISKELEVALNGLAKIKNEKAALEAKEQEVLSLKTQVKSLNDKLTELTKKNQSLAAELNTALETIKAAANSSNKVKKVATPKPKDLDTDNSRFEPFEEFYISDGKSVVIDKMIWRTKEEYAGQIPIHLKSKGLVLIAGSGFNFFDGKGTKVLEIRGLEDAYYATSYALSSDEQLLAFEDDGEIHLYEVNDLVNQKNLEHLTCFGHTRQVIQMRFLEDERYLVSDSDDGTTRVFSIENGDCKEVKRYSLGVQVAITGNGFAFSFKKMNSIIQLLKTNLMSGEEAKIATQSDDYSAKLRSFGQTKLLRYLPKADKLLALGNSVGVKGNNYDLANLWLIDAKTGKTEFITQTNSGVGSAIRDSNFYDKSISISSDERYAAYMSGYSSNTVYLYDLKNKKQMHQFEGINRDGTGITFLTDSHGLIVHNNDWASSGAVHYFAFE